MAVDTEELRTLSVDEKLRLIELLWDYLGESTAPIPLPEWVDREASRRRDEMRDTNIGLNHEETWARIERRNG